MKKQYISITGRPNAGKTSLINFLCKTKFPVGKRAGTTKFIREIELDSTLSIVDFPGFGKIIGTSKAFQEKVKDDIVNFIENNDILLGIHVIDCRTFPIITKSLDKKGYIPIDIEMISFLEEVIKDISPKVLIAITKIDRAKTREINLTVDLLNSYNLSDAEVFLISNKMRTGLNKLKSRIKELIIKRLGPSYKSIF